MRYLLCRKSISYQGARLLRLLSSDATTAPKAADSAETLESNEHDYYTTDDESLEYSVRNVSGLDPNQYRQYHGEAPILDYKDLRMRRKIFAKYGMKSGEDPRIMWPARSDILKAEEEEKEEMKSLQQRLQDVRLKKEQENKDRLQRHKTIEKNMANMPRLL